MINARILGGVQLPPRNTRKGGKTLRLVSFQRLPMKGGLRWNKEVTPYG